VSVAVPNARIRLLACGVLAGLLAVTALVPMSAQGGRATRPRVVPPQGPARQVIFTSCTSCHGIDDYAYNALDRAAWDAHLTSRHRATPVSIAQGDRDILLDWLVERFGPSSKPFPRAYVPPEITTFLTDAEAETLIGRACSTCHGVEKVNDARHSPESWRVLAVDMRERGARLSDSELERLVEWLGRVKGTNDRDRN
jgi:cytochrome c553